MGCDWSVWEGGGGGGGFWFFGPCDAVRFISVCGCVGNGNGFLDPRRNHGIHREYGVRVIRSNTLNSFSQSGRREMGEVSLTR